MPAMDLQNDLFTHRILKLQNESSAVNFSQFTNFDAKC